MPLGRLLCDGQTPILNGAALLCAQAQVLSPLEHSDHITFSQEGPTRTASATRTACNVRLPCNI